MRYHPDGYYRSNLLEGRGVKHYFGTRNFDLDSLEEGLIIPKTRQVHGVDIHLLRAIDGQETYVGDAYISDRPGVVCLARTADCVPILLCDSQRRIVAAIHAGWRGISLHIVEKTIARMVDLGSQPEDILAAMGPRIRQDCFEIGEDLKDQFIELGWSLDDFVRDKNGRSYFSLSKAILFELIQCGLKAQGIDCAGFCTFCDPVMFCSYRRDREGCGRQLSLIYLTSR